jgi:hypothetical protein
VPPAGCGHVPLHCRYPFYSITSHTIFTGRVGSRTCTIGDVADRLRGYAGQEFPCWSV